MTRTKIVAAVLALLVGGGAALVYFAPSASASDWHDYTGDLFAGHAYGMQVPAGADLLELDLHSATNGTARLALFDPAGAKVGYYALGDKLSSASIAAPKEGRYVAYVYDLDGALNLRVQSDKAPVDAKLQTINLKRQDVSIGVYDKPEKIDKAMTATLSATPVFATLLYDGSAKNLDATVASPKGTIVTISQETASAFSPGVWTAYTGTRTVEPANLDGFAYTVTAHADSFEGHLVLTTLAVDFSTPKVVAPTPPDVPVPPVVGAGNSFALGEGKAIAFDAPAGKLLLVDPKAPAKKTNESRHQQTESFSDVITVYTPEDRVLKVVQLDERHPNATLELPVAGEYVAYVQHATNEVVLAQIAGESSAPSLRTLSLANETFKLTGQDNPLFFGPDGNAQELTLKHVPVSMALKVESDLAVVGQARVYNEKGTVASWDNLAGIGPGDDFLGGTWYSPENFRAGLHHFETSGTMGTSATLVSTYFVRDLGAAPAPAPAPAAPAAPGDGLGLPI